MEMSIKMENWILRTTSKGIGNITHNKAFKNDRQTAAAF